jgi:uncharacterized protein YrzB (UPF0473 family)
MKTTTKKKNSPKPATSSSAPVNTALDEEVAVIIDTATGAEYYMFLIDFFKIEKKSYVVMVPYEPEKVRAKDAEIVILRSQVAKNGDQLYISILDKNEMESAFGVFFERFEASAKSE